MAVAKEVLADIVALMILVSFTATVVALFVPSPFAVVFFSALAGVVGLFGGYHYLTRSDT